MRIYVLLFLVGDLETECQPQRGVVRTRDYIIRQVQGITRFKARESNTEGPDLEPSETKRFKEGASSLQCSLAQLLNQDTRVISTMVNSMLVLCHSLPKLKRSPRAKQHPNLVQLFYEEEKTIQLVHRKINWLNNFTKNILANKLISLCPEIMMYKSALLVQYPSTFLSVFNQ